MRNSLTRFDEGENALKTGRNFQQLFKMQMMKKERKEGRFVTEGTQQNQRIFQDKMKEKPKRIINLLLNGANVDIANNTISKSHRNTQITHNPFQLDKLMSSSKNILDKYDGSGGSQVQLKQRDCLWRVKQLNKNFDKQKSNLLHLYRSKNKRKALSSLPSNILATSISPLSKKSQRNTISIDGNNQREILGKGKVSFRYKDIPIGQFIYEKNIAHSQSAINQSLQKRLQSICRRKQTKPIDRASTQY